MKKNYIFALFIIITTQAHGAALTAYKTLEPTSAITDERYIVAQPMPLKQDVVDAAIDFLPTKFKMTAKGLSDGSIKSGVMLFCGPTGTGKTTAARSIGQAYYKNPYYFVSVNLLGDAYRNSNQRSLDVNLKPIIELASKEPQFVVIDELQILTRIKDGYSVDRRNTVLHFLSLVDEMKKTENIVLVGVVRKMRYIPQSLNPRYLRSELYHFNPVASDAHHERLLQICLSRPSRVPRNVTNEEIKEVARYFKGDLRLVDHIVQEAEGVAFERDNEKPVLIKADIIQAFENFEEAKEECRKRKLKSESWEKWLERHDQEIKILGSVASIAVVSSIIMFSYK
ncbi:MAG: AAA family ATPase [Candidatus Dependentiae bacterium]